MKISIVNNRRSNIINTTPHLLISSDDFHFVNKFKTITSNVHSLINNDAESQTALIDIFHTLTFSNHYFRRHW
ncbi:alkaline-phosphatase family protein, putative [Medicago truncatula]|uniref:Alkaline-phosphatase family protein, putative n=1 Tax=Medicago truncatula TaxID=3880 RepID=G7I289_MEDTR|nr:alkaline-phosphatase family protein, putative [Medicago truncatula]